MSVKSDCSSRVLLPGTSTKSSGQQRKRPSPFIETRRARPRTRCWRKLRSVLRLSKVLLRKSEPPTRSFEPCRRRYPHHIASRTRRAYQKRRAPTQSHSMPTACHWCTRLRQGQDSRAICFTPLSAEAASHRLTGVIRAVTEPPLCASAWNNVAAGSGVPLAGEIADRHWTNMKLADTFIRSLPKVLLHDHK
jgi:hypothetical protein